MGHQASRGARGRVQFRVAETCRHAHHRARGRSRGRKLPARPEGQATDARSPSSAKNGCDMPPVGMHVFPGLDTVMYTSADDQRGNGGALQSEIHGSLEETRRRSRRTDLVSRGDRDFLQPLAHEPAAGEGLPLSAATAALASGGSPVSRSSQVGRPHRTHRDPSGGPGQAPVHFQDWWVRLHAAVQRADIVVTGVRDAVHDQESLRRSTRPTRPAFQSNPVGALAPSCLTGDCRGGAGTTGVGRVR